MVATGNSVWVNARDSPILHVYHATSASLLATVDCTRTVVEVLRGACVCVSACMCLGVTYAWEERVLFSKVFTCIYEGTAMRVN